MFDEATRNFIESGGMPTFSRPHAPQPGLNQNRPYGSPPPARPPGNGGSPADWRAEMLRRMMQPGHGNRAPQPAVPGLRNGGLSDAPPAGGVKPSQPGGTGGQPAQQPTDDVMNRVGDVTKLFFKQRDRVAPPAGGLKPSQPGADDVMNRVRELTRIFLKQRDRAIAPAPTGIIGRPPAAPAGTGGPAQQPAGHPGIQAMTGLEGGFRDGLAKWAAGGAKMSDGRGLGEILGAGRG